MVRIDENNANQLLAGGEPVFGITKFSDRSPEELARLRMNPETAERLAHAHEELRRTVPVYQSKPGALPSDIDWREKGAVGAVRNQGQCGSCWAFSTAETVESFWYLAGHSPLVPLSVQQIVSCDSADDNCHGGFPLSGYKYITQAGGLMSERDYPYVSGKGDVPPCNFTKSAVRLLFMLALD